MIVLTVNGQRHELDIEPETPLLWALRDEIGLTGTKYGCGIAQCGACTVHVDGVAMRSCSVPVEGVAGQKIVTIDAIDSEEARAVQAAWEKIDVPQCGYCQSGQIMSAAALLAENPKPSDDDIDQAMTGNLCRCATYVRIRAAIHDAAKALG